MRRPRADGARRSSRPRDDVHPASHALQPSRVVEQLVSDGARGLTEAEAGRRLAEAGANVIPRGKRVGALRIALRQFGDPLVGLLIAATVVSAAIGEVLDALVIGAILILNGLLGFTQEAGAERAIASLTDAVRATATVVRDGRARLIPSEGLVVGDVVAVREGERVPADLRILESDRLEANESLLTGESTRVHKLREAVAPEAPLAERTCMLYAGTSITLGEGRAIVTSVAGETEMGLIARLAGTAERPPTPLQRRMGRLSRVMVVAGVGITVLLFCAMLWDGAQAHEAFLVGVSVAVAAVPEGLAGTITVALAAGARRMAGRRAIVRHLAAVETIGAATVAATDKTGTLTLNELRVVTVEPMPGRTPADVVAAGALASTAQAVDAGGADPRMVGDPVDRAFVLAAGGANAGAPAAAGARAVRPRQEAAHRRVRRRRGSAGGREGRAGGALRPGQAAGGSAPHGRRRERAAGGPGAAGAGGGRDPPEEHRRRRG